MEIMFKSVSDDKSLKGGNGENIISFRNERWNSAEDGKYVLLS